MLTTLAYVGAAIKGSETIAGLTGEVVGAAAGPLDSTLANAAVCEHRARRPGIGALVPSCVEFHLQLEFSYSVVSPLLF